MAEKRCKNCNLVFSRKKRISNLVWLARKFCSYKCSVIYKVGANHPRWKGGYKNNFPRCLDCGRILSSMKSKFCKKHAYLVDRNHQWSGDNVGYVGVHHWIKKKLGICPEICSVCGKMGSKEGRNWNIHWANKSGKYLRDVDDWIPLCVPCHRKYDKANKLKK